MQEKEQQIAQKSDTCRASMNAMDDETRHDFAVFAEGVYAAAMFLNNAMQNIKEGV